MGERDTTATPVAPVLVAPVLVVTRRLGVVADYQFDALRDVDELERARFRRAAENGRRHGWPLVDEDGERI